MNSWSIIARLGFEPEIKFTAKGEPMLNIKVALDTGWGDNKKTLWVKCTGFGKRFETVGGLLAKGSQVGITGEITGDHWIDKSGVKVPQLELRISDITLIGKKTEGGATAPTQKASNNLDEMPDDLPF